MVAFPGGFGTLDELCEVLTLTQTKKLPRAIPVLLYGREFWQDVIRFDSLARLGLIGAQDLDLFQFADTPSEAMDSLGLQLSEAREGPTPAFARTSTCRCGPSDR